MRKTKMFAVELTDRHPQWGGKTERSPFAYREQAESWAAEEVSAAQELGMGPISYRVFPIEV